MSPNIKALRIALYTAWLKGWHQVIPSEIPVPPMILQHLGKVLNQELEGKQIFAIEPLQEKLFDDGIRCANEWSKEGKVWV
jgi:hypothetical protein